ncbi:hypothetical protein, partial [Mycolicibacterium fortuitum]
TDGWRVWWTRPGNKRPRLFPPTRTFRHRTSGTKRIRATCHKAGHQPPAERCKCGVYAVPNVVDGIARHRSMTAGVWTPRWAGAVPVLAHVTLTNAQHLDEGYGTTPVIRAATATINAMWITAELQTADQAQRLARQLQAGFNVPVAVGFPTYGQADWDQRPAWLSDPRNTDVVLRIMDGIKPPPPDGSPWWPVPGSWAPSRPWWV